MHHIKFQGVVTFQRGEPLAPEDSDAALSTAAQPRPWLSHFATCRWRLVHPGSALVLLAPRMGHQCLQIVSQVPLARLQSFTGSR
jgi:hypothetical protein